MGKGLSHSIIEDKRKGDDPENPTGKTWQHPTFEEYFECNKDGMASHLGDEEDLMLNDNESGDGSHGSPSKDNMTNLTKKERKKMKKQEKKEKKRIKKRGFDSRYFPNYIKR